MATIFLYDGGTRQADKKRNTRSLLCFVFFTDRHFSVVVSSDWWSYEPFFLWKVGNKANREIKIIRNTWSFFHCTVSFFCDFCCYSIILMPYETILISEKSEICDLFPDKKDFRELFEYFFLFWRENCCALCQIPYFHVFFWFSMIFLRFLQNFFASFFFIFGDFFRIFWDFFSRFFGDYFFDRIPDIN